MGFINVQNFLFPSYPQKNGKEKNSCLASFVPLNLLKFCISVGVHTAGKKATKDNKLVIPTWVSSICDFSLLALLKRCQWLKSGKQELGDGGMVVVNVRLGRPIRDDG